LIGLEYTGVDNIPHPPLLDSEIIHSSTCVDNYPSYIHTEL